MRFASLGSGSRGNSMIVRAGKTQVLVDCGFSLRATTQRLARLGTHPESLAGILVTHEHSDHVAGLFALARRFNLTVFLTCGTRAPIPAAGDYPECQLIEDHEAPFAIGDLQITPVVVPHDAGEPVQYVISDGQHRLGLLTDTGHITEHIVERFAGCNALVLECNHDADLLQASRYPAWLKRRIAGNHGHLENRQAAELLRRIDTSRLQHMIAAHLSIENNRPEFARDALAGALNCHPDWIDVALQEEGFAWRDLS